MSDREFTARETILFARAALLTGQAAARWCSVAGRQRLVRVVFVHGEQAALGTTPNKDHGTAGAFTAPAGALESRETVGEGGTQVSAGG
jgi:hypothetical protein